jgi:hypothetical protein
MTQPKTDPNEPHPMSVKPCGECYGKGSIRRGNGFARICRMCCGTGRYGYLPDGSRVAYSARRKEWIRT